MKTAFNIKEVMEIFNVSKRTLHYYDEIGLVVPAKNEDNQYRVYQQADLIQLQQILFYKQLGLSIKEIQWLLSQSDQEKRQFLAKFQLKLHDQIEDLQQAASQLQAFLGGKPMSQINEQQLKAQYEAEARQKYGHSAAYQEFDRRQKQMNKAEKQAWEEAMKEGLKRVFDQLNAVSNEPIDSSIVQRAVMEWKEQLMTVTDYTDEVLVLIAEGYRQDERFRAYFEPYQNEHLVDFIAESVKHHLG